MILLSFISLRAFAVYKENSLQFEISLWSNWPKWNLHRGEFRLIRKLPYTEVKFYSEVKSQTGLSSLRVSCKRALNLYERCGCSLESSVITSILFRGFWFLCSSFHIVHHQLFLEFWLVDSDFLLTHVTNVL